jgi:hypothetical protein
MIVNVLSPSGVRLPARPRDCVPEFLALLPGQELDVEVVLRDPGQVGRVSVRVLVEPPCDACPRPVATDDDVELDGPRVVAEVAIGGQLPPGPEVEPAALPLEVRRFRHHFHPVLAGVVVAEGHAVVVVRRGNLSGLCPIEVRTGGGGQQAEDNHGWNECSDRSPDEAERITLHFKTLLGFGNKKYRSIAA